MLSFKLHFQKANYSYIQALSNNKTCPVFTGQSYIVHFCQQHIFEQNDSVQHKYSTHACKLRKKNNNMRTRTKWQWSRRYKATLVSSTLTNERVSRALPGTGWGSAARTGPDSEWWTRCRSCRTLQEETRSSQVLPEESSNLHRKTERIFTSSDKTTRSTEPEPTLQIIAPVGKVTLFAGSGNESGTAHKLSNPSLDVRSCELL